jgi:hypothetical protein
MVMAWNFQVSLCDFFCWVQESWITYKVIPGKRNSGILDTLLDIPYSVPISISPSCKKTVNPSDMGREPVSAT